MTQPNKSGSVSQKGESRMKRWIAASSAVVGLVAGLACSRGDQDRARREGHDAQEKAQRQLQETRDKLRENLKSADRQTREDLNKAREQLNQALDQSKRDADKARDRLREREDNQNNSDRSHQ